MFGKKTAFALVLLCGCLSHLKAPPPVLHDENCAVPAPSFQTVRSWADEMHKKAHASQSVGALLEAQEVFNKFNVSVWSEDELKAEFAGYQKWPYQNSHGALASRLFFDFALNAPHQKLVMWALLPLCAFARDEKPLPIAMQESSRNITNLFKEHPYIRRRAALYSFAIGASYKHAPSGFMLYHALDYLYEAYRHDIFRTPPLPKYKALLEKSWKQLETVFTHSKQQILNWCDWDAIESYIPLQGEDLTDPSKLLAEAAKGLVHYYMLLGDQTADAAGKLVLYKKAAAGFDAEACHKASNAIAVFININRKKMSSKSRDALIDMKLDYHKKTAWYGHLGALKSALTQRYYEEKGIPYTALGLFDDLKRLSNLKRLLKNA